MVPRRSSAATRLSIVATHPFTLALIAHDAKKDDMVRFAREHLDELRGLDLIATKTTGTLLEAELGLDVETMASGPEGGDLQIGARIVEGKIDGVIFFRDPLTSHPHEPDIQAVLKVCDVHDVPLATNRASALLLIRSLHDELRA
jgi:methylglyoxal synthase